MVAAHPHPWLLGGPWYRWPRPGLPADGRLSVPEIQKYGHAQFAKSFLAEPQHSLLWDPEADFVHEAGFLNSRESLVERIGSLTESVKAWSSREANTKVLFRRDLYNARMTPTGLLKLFLPVHERFYLVVCELHCDTGGFPSVEAEQVCSAGFVVRRRTTTIDADNFEAFRNLAGKVRLARAGLSEILADSTVKPLVAKARRDAIDKLKLTGTYDRELDERSEQFTIAKDDLETWLKRSGVRTVNERWVGLDPADPSAKVGEWRGIPAASENLLDDGGLAEHVVPMRRVFAPPGDADHDATGRALYFGVIPTTALQHDRSGTDRFDDQSVYEIRCFVRRRRTDCLRIPGPAGCRGELTWSRPTRPYALASPADLYGTANRPVTIRMPDLEVLKTQIATAPPGRFSSTAFVQPQQLTTSEKGVPTSQKRPGAAAVCYFALPLIMIVALFVLNLFLPIILFVFQLWWMLALKFCLPPRISIDAGLAAALDGKFPEPGIDTDFDAGFPIDDPDGPGVLTKAQVLARLNPALVGQPMGPESDRDKLLFAIASHKLPADGLAIDFLADDYYPTVRPVWSARPQEVTP